MRMLKNIYEQTRHCVRCGKPAVTWTGAVRNGRRWMLAGWCKQHWACQWYHGEFRPAMGRMSAS